MIFDEIALLNKYPETKVYYSDPISKNKTQWKAWKDCTQEEKEKVNNRTIFPNEIHLDLDTKEAFESTRKKLSESPYEYVVVDNQSGRGAGHIILQFDDLPADYETRKQVKKLFIPKYEAEAEKASENVSISMIGRPHNKTGKLPIIIEEHPGHNKLPDGILENAKKIIEANKNREIEPDDNFANYSETDELFNFIKNNKIPDGTNRNNTLFPNIAIALVKQGLNKQEIKDLMEPILKKSMRDKTYSELDGWVDKALKGEIDTYNKKQLNNWIDVNFPNKIKKYTNDKPELIIPGQGKLISKFAIELSNILKTKNMIFFRPESQDIVEVLKIEQESNNCTKKYTGFKNIAGSRFITLAEKYCIPGVLTFDKQDRQFVFTEKSISRELATTLLHSDIFHKTLRQINRIFTIPIPIIHGKELTFPKKGYDERFNSWLPHDAPEITNPDMTLDEAKKIIDFLFAEFCFKDKNKDKTNAIAALLTPFLRGIFSKFNVRTPVFFYVANRERSGKDYCAGITSIVYEGEVFEEAPISTSENAKSSNTEEFRKKVLAAMMNGKKRMHFSNNKGYINNAVFESIITAPVWNDRILGKSTNITFDNELDFTLSGNVGIGYTPDFANRCKFIRLFLDIEDANARKFKNPTLHDYVKNNRNKILSALFVLVNNWIKKGRPSGSLPFTSFPEWAKICGGVMEAAGYDNPCEPDKELLALNGDSETQDMKALFEVCYNKYPEQWITKKDIKNIILQDDYNIFSYLDFTNKSDQTKFGNKIIKFYGRILSDIRLVVKNPEDQAFRHEIKFTKEIHNEN